MPITQTVMIFLPLIFSSYVPGPMLDLGKGVGNPNNNHECTHPALNVDWWYNWATSDIEQCGGNFVPMVWSTEVGQRLLDDTMTMDDSLYVLYLNEPSLVEQANDTPQEAAAMLPLLQAKYPGRRWIVGNVWSIEWLDQFMIKCAECDIYGIGVHYYSWYCPVEYLTYKIDAAAVYGKPVFVTEFACLSANTEYQIEHVGDWLDVMEERTQGYAPYSTRNPDGFPEIFNATNLVGTKLGAWYASQ